MLIASDSSRTAVWVDPSVPFEGTTAGIIQRDEGFRSVWMITGSLMHTTVSLLARSFSADQPDMLSALIVLTRALIYFFSSLHSRSLRPQPSNIPRTPRDSLPKSIAKKLQKALPVLLAAVLVLHTPTLKLREWEEVAATRMEAGLLTREKKRRLALEETERNKEEDAQLILNFR